MTMTGSVAHAVFYYVAAQVYAPAKDAMAYDIREYLLGAQYDPFMEGILRQLQRASEATVRDI